MTHTTKILNFLHHSGTQHGAALLFLFVAFPRFVLAMIVTAFLIRPLAYASAFVQLFCKRVGSLKIFN